MLISTGNHYLVSQIHWGYNYLQNTAYALNLFYLKELSDSREGEESLRYWVNNIVW